MLASARAPPCATPGRALAADPPRDAARSAAPARSAAARVGRGAVRLGRAAGAPRRSRARGGAPTRPGAIFRSGRADDATSLDWLAVCREPARRDAAGSRTATRAARCAGSRASRLRYAITRFRIYDCARCRVSTCGRRSTTARCASCSSASTPRARARCPSSRPTTTSPTTTRPTTRSCRSTSAGSTRIERERPPGQMLDVGCGTGLFLAVARRRGWQPYGVDDCGDATAHAREHFGLDVWDGQFTDFARARACASTRSRCGTSSSTRATPWPARGCAQRARAGRRDRDLDAEPAEHPRPRRGAPVPRFGRPDHAAAREVLHRAALPLLRPRHAARTRSTAPARARGARARADRPAPPLAAREPRGCCSKRCSSPRA